MAAAEEKKKGRFGGKKYKKLHDSAEQANKDAADIKKRFMAVQTEAYEAATLAATTRSVADRLRDEAESAELQMVSAASAQQKAPASTPAPAPAPVPIANNTFATNGGYEMPSPKPSYEGIVIGIGIAGHIFFGWPYYIGVVLSLITTMSFLATIRCGMRVVELIVVIFVGIMSIVLVVEMALLGVNVPELMKGWVYGFTETTS